jgi:hypothetical protein
MTELPILWSSLYFILADDFDVGDVDFNAVIAAAIQYHRVLLTRNPNGYRESLARIIRQFADPEWVDRYNAVLPTEGDVSNWVSIKQILIELHLTARASQWTL